MHACKRLACGSKSQLWIRERKKENIIAYTADPAGGNPEIWRASACMCVCLYRKDWRMVHVNTTAVAQDDDALLLTHAHTHTGARNLLAGA